MARLAFFVSIAADDQRGKGPTASTPVATSPVGQCGPNQVLGMYIELGTRHDQQERVQQDNSFPFKGELVKQVGLLSCTGRHSSSPRKTVSYGNVRRPEHLPTRTISGMKSTRFYLGHSAG